MKKATNYSTVRKRTKGVHMIHQNLLKNYPLDPIAEKVLEGLEGKVCPSLQGYLMIILRGFDENMQLEMADNLLDFVNDNILHRTGCYSVDVTLAQCYMWIGMEQGIVKEKVVEEWLNAYKY